MSHKPKCRCFACENGMEALKKIEAECIKKVGWFAHLVMNEDKCPNGVNAHTHNVKEKFGHKDIQICLSVNPQVISGLFAIVVGEIRKGRKFESGIEYDNIFDGGFKAKFLDAFECGRPVLRLLIPDKNGKYEGAYATQLTKLNNEEFNPNLN